MIFCFDIIIIITIIVCVCVCVCVCVQFYKFKKSNWQFLKKNKISKHKFRSSAGIIFFVKLEKNPILFENL